MALSFVPAPPLGHSPLARASLARTRTSRSARRLRMCNANAESPSTHPSSALDEIPSSLKFNAVAEALARQRDHPAVLRLLSEMRQRDVPLTQTAQTALIDSAVTDHQMLSTLLHQITPPGYSSTSLAEHAPSKTPAPLVIDPTRPADLSLASMFSITVFPALSVQLLERPLFHHEPPHEVTTMLAAVAVLLLVDRYIASSPLWQGVRRGWMRMLSNDPVRMARVDAACFLVAYVLGLPWLCFQPDGLRAFRWLRDRGVDTDDGDRDREEIVERCVTWLVAGVAAEVEIDGLLIHSQLRAGREFLREVRKEKGLTSQKMTAGEVERRLREGVARAQSVIEGQGKSYEMLAGAMVSGASVGECVAMLSKQFNTRA